MSNTPPPRDDDGTPNGAAEPDTSTQDDRGAEAPVDAASEHPESDRVEEIRAEAPVPLVEPSEPSRDVEGAEERARETNGYEERIVEPEKPVDTDTAVAPTTDTDTGTDTAVGSAPPIQTVYVTAPVPPRKRSNRGVGTLYAVLSVVVFAVFYTAIMGVVISVMFPGNVIGRLISFLGSSAFIVPLLVFVVSFIVLVLIANRANWWAYVLGSFLVAVSVYFVSIGIVLVTANVFGMTPEEARASFVALAGSPSIIVATILAREVTIWFGAAIAASGRRVRARNLEARAEYDRDVAAQQAEHARP